MIDSRTVGGFLASIGWSVKRGRTSGALLVAPPTEPDVAPSLPPLRIDVGDHWARLVLGPVFAAKEKKPPDLALRLLTVNRDLRIAKFGIDERDHVVLSAELPTGSLHKDEVIDAATRIVRYFRHYRSFLEGND